MTDKFDLKPSPGTRSSYTVIIIILYYQNCFYHVMQTMQRVNDKLTILKIESNSNRDKNPHCQKSQFWEMKTFMLKQTKVRKQRI